MNRSDIEYCNTVIDAAINALWPTIGVKACFFPNVDLQYGDIGSGVLLELSQHLKLPPEVLAETLLAKLHSLGQGDGFSCEHGFVNYRPVDSATLISQESILHPSTVRICFCGRSASISIEGAMRVLFSAFLQARIAIEIGMEVTYYGHTGEMLITNSNFHQVLRNEIREILTPRAVVIHELINFIERGIGKQTFLWLPSGTYSRKMFQGVVRHPERARGNVHLRSPDETILDDIPQLDQHYISQISDNEFSLNSALYYFSSLDPGADVDPHVVFLQESANTFWFSRFLRERLGGKGLSLDEAQSIVRPENEEDRCLITRVRFFTAHRQHAASRGFTGEYISVCRDILSRANRYFNNPQLRYRIETASLTEYDRQILSGVWRVLQLI